MPAAVKGERAETKALDCALPGFSGIMESPMQTFRTVSTSAIVIRRERMGESHKDLVLLTADLGLVRATAYGAWKMHSTLRTGSEPFAHSLARLYHDPVRNTYKVTDLEVRESFDGLRADLGRIEAASLWAEVVLEVHRRRRDHRGALPAAARLPARPGGGIGGPGALRHRAVPLAFPRPGRLPARRVGVRALRPVLRRLGGRRLACGSGGNRMRCVRGQCGAAAERRGTALPRGVARP